AFEQVGANAERVHINRLRERPALLDRYQILAIPGGFAHGDDIAAGKIFATQLTTFLGDALRRFRDREKLILGVCNGFQVLLKARLPVPPEEAAPPATLTHNTRGYQDRWLYAQTPPARSPFPHGIDGMPLPMAHGEGNFVCRKDWI